MLPVVVGQLVQACRITAAARVVDEHVDAPELVERALGDQGRSVRIEQVGRDLHDAHAVGLGLQRRCRQRVDVAGVEHEVRTFAREVERDLLADAATRAGDDGDAVAHSEVHQPSDATCSA